MPGPLAGLTVLELGGIGPGAFAGMLLADLGADVVRIDRPSPAAGGLEPLDPRADVLNRGKRSLALDLKHPEAAGVFLAMAAHADVVTEGYRPGVAERLGIGPDECLAVNPALVYGRMTGWGQKGPLAAAAGHDVDYIAITGALHAVGPADGPPQIPLNLVGDMGGGGVYLVIGVLAALQERARSGRGQVIDAAIVDGTSHLLATVHALLAAGVWTDARGANPLDGGTPFYAVYETADGQHIAVGAGENKFYAQLLRGLNLPDDPRDQMRTDGWPDLRRRIAAAFASRTRAEWSAVFEGTDACVAPVLGLREAADHPHIRARGSLEYRDGVLQPGVAPRFSRSRPTPTSPPPIPGEHTAAVLRSLGVPAGERLLANGVVRQAPSVGDQ